MADNVAKKVGRFVANEMLGIDDVKRAVSKAKQGDIKGAVKSAATAALEAGSTVSGAGLGAKLGAKVAAKAAEKTVVKRAAEAGARAEKTALERTPAGKLGTAGGEIKKVKATESKVTSKSGATSSSPSDQTITYKTPPRSFEQRLGDQAKQDTKRETAGINARMDTAEAIISVGKKEISKAKTKGALKGAVTGAAASAVTKEAVKGSQANHHVTDSKNHTKTVK